MRRNPDFLMREVADTVVVVPVGAATTEFHGMITLNETGACLWEQLAQEQTLDSLTEAVLKAYEVSQSVARADVERFVDRLLPTGAISL